MMHIYCLGPIKYNAFVLHLTIVCFISVFVFHSVEKDCYCYGARRPGGGVASCIAPGRGQDTNSGQLDLINDYIS